MTPNVKLLSVEIVYALPESQLLVELEVIPGTTARGAIEKSGILQRFPRLDLLRHRIGIFGRVVDPERELSSGDRVEIYRALVADPRDARRLRAKKKN